MRHNGRRLAMLGLALATAGCFDAHGREGGDGGTAPGDGGRVITSCEEARFAPDGAACAFVGSCEGMPIPCGPSSSVSCVDGRIRTLRPICTRALPRNCDEYLAWGLPPGDICLTSDFTGCTLELDSCCVRQIDCRENRIVDDTWCTGCGPHDTCPGYAAPPPAFPPCTSSADCEGGIACRPPSARDVCGICRPSSRECEADADCGPGGVCAERELPCSCEGEPDTICTIDCRTAESDPCAAGERCSTEDGHCRAISCAEGWACALNERCTPGAGASDAHGCARLECDDASDCDCGACIDGRCEDGPGVCMPPVP